MKTLTEMMLRFESVDRYFRLGTERSPKDREYRRTCRAKQARIRAKHGFAERYSQILTDGDHNAKLAHAETWSVGLTLQPYVNRLTSGLVVNCCPNATPGCIKGCVISHAGRAQFDPRIERARRAKTEFFALHPCEACFLYGWELADQVEKHGFILNRPNVGSDAEWEKILPSLTSGAAFGKAVLSYGYTKLPGILVTDGWLDSFYRVAYSWNEDSDPVAVAHFLERGGSVAVVTSRRKGEWRPSPFHLPGHPGGYFVNHYRVIDADKTDEWIFEPGAIGDLSAKGKARRLIGKSGFIVTTGAAA